MATPKKGRAWRVLPAHIQVTPFREVPAGRMLASDDADWLEFDARHKDDYKRAGRHRTHCRSGLLALGGSGDYWHWPGRPECEPYDAPEKAQGERAP